MLERGQTHERAASHCGRREKGHAGSAYVVWALRAWCGALAGRRSAQVALMTMAIIGDFGSPSVPQQGSQA